MFELFVQLSKKFFPQEEARGSSLFQQILLGPIFIIASLSIAFFKTSVSSEWSSTWFYGLAFSLSLGLFISLLSFQEVRRILSMKDDQLLSLKKMIEDAAVRAESEKEGIFDQVKAAEQVAQEREKRIRALEDLSMQRKYDWERLEEEKEALFQEVVSLHEALAKPVQKRSHHPIDEVRKQFEEKAQVLNETRKELFQIESSLIALQKESEERLLEPNKDLDALISHFLEFEIYSATLEEENKILHDLVSLLSVKKLPAKRKKATKKVDEKIISSVMSKKINATPSEIQ